MKREAYPTDLTEDEWPWIVPLLPRIDKPGRPRKHPLRGILNAIFYVIRTGSLICIYYVFSTDVLDVHFVSPAPVPSPGSAGLQPGSRSHAGAWRSQGKPARTGRVCMKQTSRLSHWPAAGLSSAARSAGVTDEAATDSHPPPRALYSPTILSLSSRWSRARFNSASNRSRSASSTCR